MCARVHVASELVRVCSSFRTFVSNVIARFAVFIYCNIAIPSCIPVSNLVKRRGAAGGKLNRFHCSAECWAGSFPPIYL
jgi:hypothetical protein